MFFASADVQLVFPLNDQETRERISVLVGSTERKKHSESSSGQVTTTYERVNVIQPLSWAN